MTTAIVEYSATEAALAELTARYRGIVYACGETAGLAEAKKARAELRDYRVSMEKIRKDIKGPALERCRLIDAEAKRITESLTALEDPIDAQIKVEEGRKEREKAEREAAELKRIADIQARIANINRVAPSMVGKPSADIEMAGIAVESIEIGDSFEEFRETAQGAKDLAVATLRQLYAGAKAQEDAAAAEAKRVAEERAELARLRAEQQERERQESERLAEERARREAEDRQRAAEDAERRAAIDAEERASRERVAAEERAARERIEAADRLARQLREEAEAKERAERAATEAKERERQHQENELLDGEAMLLKFKERFGRRKEFASVIHAINAYQFSHTVQKVDAHMRKRKEAA